MPDNDPSRSHDHGQPYGQNNGHDLPEPETVRLRSPRPHRRLINPALALIAGFAGLILIGTILLLLPFASVQEGTVGFTAALFTATSAVCVTGLIVLDTGTAWTSTGHVIILVLIQLGGFGFMTSATLLLMFVLGQRTSLQQRLLLGQSIGESLPGQVLQIVRRIAVVTLVLEVLGTVLLFPRMVQEMDAGHALWWSLFHSVSAFNNAGFDLVGDYQGLAPYASDIWILSVIGGLAFLGAISYTVMAETVETRGVWRRMSVDTRLVLSVTLGLLGLSAAVLLLAETGNPETLGPMSWPERILNAVFFSAAPSTAGFTVLPMSGVLDETAAFTTARMFIGGASGSTAGGIKLQTFGLLFFAIVAAARNRDQVVAFGREIPTLLIFRALAVALVSIPLIFLSSVFLSIFSDAGFISILFEAISAYSTAGLSMGITPDLDSAARILLTVTMFVGRLGPLALILALAARSTRQTIRYAQETVKIG